MFYITFLLKKCLVTRFVSVYGQTRSTYHQPHFGTKKVLTNNFQIILESTLFSETRKKGDTNARALMVET